MNTNKIEKEISDKIIIWVKDNPKATQTEIKNKITQEITKKNYLKEDWQRHYAKERILIFISKELGINFNNNRSLYYGRLGRLNFFLFNLLYVVLYFSILLLNYFPWNLFVVIFFIIWIVFMIILFYLLMCAHIRRLHDIGLSGWWLILGYIPVITIFFILFLFFVKGTNGTNKYGDKLKENINFIEVLFNRAYLQKNGAVDKSN